MAFVIKTLRSFKYDLVSSWDWSRYTRTIIVSEEKC